MNLSEEIFGRPSPRGSREEAVHCPQLRTLWKPAEKQGLERWKEVIYKASRCGCEEGRKRSTQMAAHLAKPACLQGAGRTQSLTHFTKEAMGLPACVGGGNLVKSL